MTDHATRTTRRLAAALRTYAARLDQGNTGDAIAAACRAADFSAALAHSRALPAWADEPLDLLLGDDLADDHPAAAKLARATADLLLA